MKKLSTIFAAALAIVVLNTSCSREAHLVPKSQKDDLKEFVKHARKGGLHGKELDSARLEMARYLNYQGKFKYWEGMGSQKARSMAEQNEIWAEKAGLWKPPEKN